MKSTPQLELPERLEQYLDQAAQLDSPILIERGGDEHDVVIVSDRDFRDMVTTIEILPDPERAARLLRSIRSFDAAVGIQPADAAA